jgi:hypothetical protein
MSIADDLQQLSDLFERGLLTREQFDAAKGRLLGAEVNTGPSSDAALSRAAASSNAPSPPGAAEGPLRSTEQTAWLPGGLQSAVSARAKSVISFVSENKIPSAVAGVLVSIFVAAVFFGSVVPAGETPQPTPATNTIAPFNVRYESVHHLRSKLESVGFSCTRWLVFDFPGQGATERADCTDAVLLTIYPDERTARRAVDEAGQTIARYGLVGFYILGPNWSFTCGNAEVSCHLLRNEIGGEVVSNVR